MPKYRLIYETKAWFYIDIEAKDEDTAVEEGYQEIPEICAQCSGWGRSYSLELGDEWESIDAEPYTTGA